MKALNAAQIKYIAMLLMFIDHIYQMFVHLGAPLWMHCLGRLVFPMFLFISADSFHYTSNRGKYLKRLFIGHCIMVIGNTIIQKLLPNDNIVIMNNAFSTFFVIGLYVVFYDRLIQGIKTKDKVKISTSIILFLLPILSFLPFMAVSSMLFDAVIDEKYMSIIYTLILIIPNIFLAEGGIYLVVMGLLFYIFRQRRYVQISVLAAFSIMIGFMTKWQSVQYLMVFAFIPMLMYNGKKGRSDKWLFYIFYPLHIYGLYIISTLFFK